MPAAFVTYQISTVGLNGTLVSGPTGTYGSAVLTPPTAGATLVDVTYAAVQGQGASTELRTITVWRFDP